MIYTHVLLGGEEEFEIPQGPFEPAEGLGSYTEPYMTPGGVSNGV